MTMHYSSKKIILIAVIVAIGLFGIYKFGVAFSPGSYAYAETYEINAPEPEVINAIQNLKKAHPDLSSPTSLLDGRKGNNDYWYHIYFYYPDKKQIVYSWTRPATNNRTTLAFVSISEGLTFGNWKLINKDFTAQKNQEFKEEFERRIFDSIKQRLAVVH
jgi:hypothetical protein